MKKYIKYLLFLLPVIFCSCSVAGIRHYYKSVGNEWYPLDCKPVNALYGNGATNPLVKVVGKDSFALYNIQVETDNYKSSYALGICYLPIIPDFFHLFNTREMRFYLSFELNVTPQQSTIKFDDIQYYLNDDSTDSKPIKTWNNFFNSFGCRFNIRTTQVKKVLIKFVNFSINGTKIDIPDLTLEHDWGIYDTMNWMEY